MGKTMSVRQKLAGVDDLAVEGELEGRGVGVGRRQVSASCCLLCLGE